MPASAGDGKAFVVKQVFDVANGFHIFVTVEAMTLGTLHWLEHGKFGFPITQHERFGVGEAADLADTEKTACGGGFLAGVYVFVWCVFVHCSSVYAGSKYSPELLIARAASTARTRLLLRAPSTARTFCYCGSQVE